MYFKVLSFCIFLNCISHSHAASRKSLENHICTCSTWPHIFLFGSLFGNESYVLKGKCMKYELIDLLAGGKLLSHYLECDWFDIYVVVSSLVSCDYELYNGFTRSLKGGQAP